MGAFLLFAALILISKYDQVLSDDDDSAEKVEEQSLTSELVNILNGTYFNLNEKLYQLQRKVDAIERVADPGHQCECNKTEYTDFKRLVSDELHAFSKILSGFENQMRILQNEQTELRQLLGGGNSNGRASTTTTTTPTSHVCEQGWISSPEKCYYVSTYAERTNWSTALSRCTSMGAKLVEIQTDEEATYIMSNMPNRVEQTYLIYTGRKLNDAGDWVFVSNDKMVDTSVRTWEGIGPDGNSQNCGCTRASDDFLMHDCVCTGFDFFYICEIER